MKLELRYPATPENALDHAQLAVEVAWSEFGLDLDYTPGSLEAVDAQVDSLREDGLTGEDAAEALFVLGSARSRLAGISPWPMVVVLADGSAWDPIGKVYKRLELGDSEYLPAFFAAAAAGLSR
jgi:hypothetical protein